MKRIIFTGSLLLFSPLLADFPAVERVSLFARDNGEIHVSRRPQIDHLGQIVVFESTLSYAGKKRKKEKAVYFYDRATQAMKMIEGQSVEAIHGEPSISGDGRLIVFQSQIKNLLPNLPPAKADIEIFDRIENRYGKLSRGLEVQDHDGECSSPTLNFAGTKVAFSCNATNMHVQQRISIPQIFLGDVSSQSLELVSLSTTGQVGNRISGDPMFSDDAQWIFFKSASTNFGNGLAIESMAFHLYMKNLVTGGLIQIDKSVDGLNIDDILLGDYDISAHGDVVVFQGRIASGEDPVAHLERSHLYLYERASGSLRRLSQKEYSEKAHDPSISGDGRYVVFVYKGSGLKSDEQGLVVMDLEKKISARVFRGMCHSPQISGDGRTIVFESLIRTGPNKPDIIDILLIENPL